MLKVTSETKEIFFLLKTLTEIIEHVSFNRY
jgi:hypothetical protein